uniref:Uncharacterized protein n=1 Tax=Timema douglasi TaxID=61478 RepID=A0A7R8ZBD5_TIMDO|nr:unnamed protein product [Timema douglasi]
MLDEGEEQFVLLEQGATHVAVQVVRERLVEILKALLQELALLAANTFRPIGHDRTVTFQARVRHTVVTKLPRETNYVLAMRAVGTVLHIWVYISGDCWYMGSSPGRVPRLDGHGVQVDEPHQRVLVHGVHVGQVCDAIVQHGGVSRYWTVAQSETVDLQLGTLEDSSPFIRTLEDSSPFIRTLEDSSPFIRTLEESSPFIRTLEESSTSMADSFSRMFPSVPDRSKITLRMFSNTRGTHLSLATTIPSSWSSSPSMVRAKLTMVTLLNTSGKNTIEKIKENIGDSYFWASVDETTDRCGRYITNIVVGKLDSTGPSSPRLKSLTARQLPELFVILCTFDEEDAVSIREAKVATSSSSVVSDMVNVKSYFGNLLELSCHWKSGICL